jgi:hypothetical protein
MPTRFQPSGDGKGPRCLVEIADVETGMMRLLFDKGHVYVNKEVLTRSGYGRDSYTVKEFVLPGQKIVIKKWPNGIHFYAGTSVTYNGTNK